MKKHLNWRKAGNYGASFCCLLLLAMFWHGNETPFYIVLFVYALIISVWEWMLRPLLMEIKSYLESKSHNRKDKQEKK